LKGEVLMGIKVTVLITVLAIVLVLSLIGVQYFVYKVHQVKGQVQIPRRAVVDVWVVDEAGRPLSNVRVYVFAVYDNGPSRIVGRDLTDESGHASIEFYLDDDLYRRVLRERFLNLFIDCYMPNQFLETRALSLPPPYQIGLTIVHGSRSPTRSLLGMMLISPSIHEGEGKHVLASEAEQPELIDFEEKPKQLTWITEIHSVIGVRQTIIISENAYIEVDALTRTGTDSSFYVAGSFSMTFSKSASQYVEDGDASNVKGYYTYMWERWVYPDGTIIERAYCTRWEGVITKSGTVGGDGALPPYPSSWHWYEITGGGSISHSIAVNYRISIGARVYFSKIELTLDFGVTAKYSSRFKRVVEFNGTVTDIYYIYDRGLGKDYPPETWPFIYVAKKG